MKRRKIITGIISGNLILTSATAFLESPDIALAKRQNGTRLIQMDMGERL